MAISGITLQDEVTSSFNELKLGRGLQYIIYRITPDFKEVAVEKKQAAPATWEDLVKDLPSDDCRYAVFDFHYETASDGERNKLIFILWTPDTAKIKVKMLYPSTKDALRRSFVGIGTEVQATDVSELSIDEVKARLLKN
jgi:cofilin